MYCIFCADRSNESSIACQGAVHCIEPSKMQVTEVFNNWVFHIRTDFAVDSACWMLAGGVPSSNLFIGAAHIICKRVSGPH
jgi:hypothetical protein